jgi:hypothetical protein
MRAILKAVVLIGLLLLTACGQSGAANAPQPTLPSPPTSAPAATAAVQPTQPAAPTSAPPTVIAQPTQPAAPTSPPTATMPPDVIATKAAPSAGPAPTGDESMILVILHQTGGFIGIDKTLTVYTDGKITLTGDGGDKEAQVPPSELATLEQLLASPEFAALQPRYHAQGNDLFTYEITVPDDGKPQTVVTMDGANHPEVLTQVLAELNKLAAQVQ